jgi:hypothetical protein
VVSQNDKLDNSFIHQIFSEQLVYARHYSGTWENKVLAHLPSWSRKCFSIIFCSELVNYINAMKMRKNMRVRSGDCLKHLKGKPH